MCMYVYRHIWWMLNLHTHVYVWNTFIWKVLRNMQSNHTYCSSSQGPQWAWKGTSHPHVTDGKTGVQYSVHVAETWQSQYLNACIHFPNSEISPLFHHLGTNWAELHGDSQFGWGLMEAESCIRKLRLLFPWAFWGQSLKHWCLKTQADKIISCQHLCNLHFLLQMSLKYICIERKMFLVPQVSYHDNKIRRNCVWVKK